jgi:hypothetical protein
VLLKNIKVVEGKYFKTFVFESEPVTTQSQMTPKMSIRTSTYISKKSSKYASQNPSPINKAKHHSIPDLPFKLIESKLKKRFVFSDGGEPQLSPVKKGNETVANITSPGEIRGKYGLKLPKIKKNERAITQFLGEKDFYYK